jgi:hypothetical protein
VSNTETTIQNSIEVLGEWRIAFTPIISAFSLTDEQAARIAQVDELLSWKIEALDLDELLMILEAAKYFGMAVEKLFALSPQQRTAQRAIQESWKVAFDLWKA